jgi:hypothetical protein
MGPYICIYIFCKFKEECSPLAYFWNDGRIEMVVVYASKNLFNWCSKEVSSYGRRMLWSGMGSELHFWQYLHQT